MKVSMKAETTQIVTIKINLDEAFALSDALAYFQSCASNNFDMGYRGEDGQEAKAKHAAVNRLAKRLNTLVGDA